MNRIKLPVAAGLCLLSQALFAEQQEPPIELEDLVVTAGLVPVAEEEVAGSLTIITAEDIEQRQAVFLSDLLRTVPGFSVSQSGGPGAQTQVRVRGAEANHVLVLVDGVRVNDPASSDEFQFQYALGPHIERIEILRGPQSATWGTDALAGVINIIHKRPDDRPSLVARGEAGSMDTRHLSLDGQGVLGGTQAWFGLSALDSDGSNVSRLGSERDGTQNRTFQLGLDWDVDPALSIGVSGRRVEAESEFDDIDFFETGLPTDADRHSEIKRTDLQAHLDYRPKDSAWNTSLTAAIRDSDNRNFADGLWTDETRAETRDFEIRATRSFGARRSHRVSLAADYQRVRFGQRGTATPFGDPNQDQDYTVHGIAAEWFGRPTDRLNWSASVRQDDFDAFDNATTWQLATSLQVREDLRLRARIGSGSKAPTFTERFGFFPGTFLGNPALEPESSRGWEVGGAYNFARARAQMQFAWFEQKLENEIDGFVFDAASGLFTARNRNSSSKREGFEVTLQSRVTKRFDLSVNFSHIESSEPGFNGSALPEVRRPENQASLVGNYRFAEGRGNLNLAVTHSGDQFDLFFSPQTFTSERLVLEQHTVVDLAASWRLRPDIELIGRVQNLLDEQYEEVLGFMRPGRSAYAGFRVRLGEAR
ncbi:MAG: TonB-dependent receptor [Xanthomonadales bacterium]|nr:TonB-dependent receptor [Xanthomonadales bacterium]